MTSLSTFFAMGGYAGFIWPAYGLAGVVLVGLMVVSRRALKAAERDLAALEGAQETNRPGEAP